MNTNASKRKSKRPKRKNTLTTSSGPSKLNNRCNDNTVDCAKRVYSPLIAKDSEWVDILLEGTSYDTKLTSSNNKPAGEEAQRNDEQIKPITLMFPDLLRDDPRTLEGIVSKALSTTDVARHLVGQKANFSFLRKVDRLIPPDRTWLDRLSENSNSCTSTDLTENKIVLASSFPGSLKSKRLASNETKEFITSPGQNGNNNIIHLKTSNPNLIK